jgi:P4 family phage/plasmid primase-like protien
MPDGNQVVIVTPDREDQRLHQEILLHFGEPLDTILRAVKTVSAYEGIQRTDSFLFDFVQHELYSMNHQKPPSDETLKEESHHIEIVELVDVDDLKLGYLWAKERGPRYKFCPETGWLWWEGRYWISDTKDANQVRRDVGLWCQKRISSLQPDLEGLLSMHKLEEDKTEKKRLAFKIKHVDDAIARLSMNRTVTAIMERASSYPWITTPLKDFDKSPYLFNMQNGTYDLIHHISHRHDPGDLLTKMAPFEYDPHADPLRWDAFTRRIIPDESTRLYLQEWAGYCLTANRREHLIHIFIGSGQNGKSVYLNTLKSMMGEYAKTLDFTVFQKNAKQDALIYLAGLVGRRFVTAIEAETEAELNMAVIKRLASEDPIQARVLTKMPFEYEPVCKVCLALNIAPTIEEQTKATRRRFRFVPFDVEITDEEKDQSLTDKMRESNLPSVFNWAVEGLKRYQRQGLTTANTVVQKTEEIFDDSNPFFDFLNEFCTVDKNVLGKSNAEKTKSPYRQAPRPFYLSYQVWELEHGVQKKMSEKEFNLKMSQYFYRITLHGTRLYCGVEILDSKEMDRRAEALHEAAIRSIASRTSLF